MEIDAEILDSGCCGMAGSFGFEQGHYDVSRAIGELVLLPRVRNADTHTLIVADGFSCREQIAQLTNRRAVHMADLVALALREREDARPQYPERECLPDYAADARRTRRAAYAAAALLAGAYGLYRMSRPPQAQVASNG